MRFKLFIIIAVTCIGLASCSKDEPKIQPMETNRTVLVYMIANNSLGNSSIPDRQYDDKDLNEMQVAFSQNEINDGRLIVYHVPPISEGVPVLKEITSNGVVELKRYKKDTLSTDPAQLEQVILDMYEYAPALDYGLILWSHSSAWVEYPSAKSVQAKKALSAHPLAFGEEITSIGTSYMKVTSLAQVLNNHNFSFIYFDSCHMASIEVVYELKDATKYIIASTTELPADGMPYDLNIPLFFTETPQLEQACRNTFNFYDKLSGDSRTCAISLIETTYIDDLATISKGIFGAKSKLPSGFAPQQFVVGNCYSYDFEQYMLALAPSEEYVKGFQTVLSNVVKYKNSTPSIWGSLKIKYHCGLGCNILKRESDATINGYNNHKWWYDVVQYQFQ